MKNKQYKITIKPDHEKLFRQIIKERGSGTISSLLRECAEFYFKSKENNLVEVAEAIKNLPFGEHKGLPWCRESFPELDIAMKKYEASK